MRKAPGTLYARDYEEVFRSLNIKTIVRLNTQQYHSEEYTQAGFRHHDLIFPDCRSLNLTPDALHPTP